MPSFNRSKLNAAISKFNSAARQYNHAAQQYNRNLRRARDRALADLRALQRQLLSLRMTRTVRTSFVIQHELQVALSQGDAGFLVREEEWDTMSSWDQQHLRAWTEQRDMEIIVVDDDGDELYRL